MFLHLGQDTVVSFSDIIGIFDMDTTTVQKSSRTFLNKAEKRGEVFIFRPQEDLKIGRMEKDPGNIQRVYDLGYADAEKNMRRLREWMEST